MTFKEIMTLPLSKDDSTTVAQDICRHLNRAYKEGWSNGQPCMLGYDIFVFHCPDHEIQQDEIFAHIAWEHTNLGAQEHKDTVKTFKELVRVWSRTNFLNQPRDFESL